MTRREAEKRSLIFGDGLASSVVGFMAARESFGEDGPSVCVARKSVELDLRLCECSRSGDGKERVGSRALICARSSAILALVSEDVDGRCAALFGCGVACACLEAFAAPFPADGGR